MAARYLAGQIDRLRKLIADGDTLNAVDALSNLASGSPTIYNVVLLQRSRYVRTEREERKGLLTHEQAAVEKNRINEALYSLLDELPGKMTHADMPIAPTQPSAESVPISLVKQEKIIGINNLKQLSWIARGLECARSVCRVLTPSGLGTGFLVAPGLVMTNNHVIPSAKIASQTRVEFNYQMSFDGSYEHAYRYSLELGRFHTDATLDYTIVGVDETPPNPPLKDWGRLELNPNADPVYGELVSIIQHPNGGLKQIVMTANQVVGLRGPYLWYTADTLGGSSGSPVFSDLWQVIAIHHGSADNGYNEGVLMSHIQPSAEAQGFWPQGQTKK